jgi:hypothetical protein
MPPSPRSSPVVLDARLDDEKLAELLAHGTEYPELDFKRKIDPTTTEDSVELALDVGAMQVRGAYILVGFDNTGAPTGDLADVEPAAFDEARLAPQLRRYLPDPLELRTRVTEHGGHRVALIYIGRHPSGCAIFRADGQYEKDGALVVRFRAGEVFWRNGTRSERISQQGFEEIIARRIADEKAAWLDEQQEIRRRERAELEASVEAQRVARSSLGAVSLDLEAAALVSAALELVRDDDAIALRHLLNEALNRARSAIERDEVETELADVVDKLACLGAAFLEYELPEWFERVVDVLARIFSEGFRGEDPLRFGYATSIPPTEIGPRVWLLVIERVYALGALAVRLGNWPAVRSLALRRPAPVDEYYGNWLRWAITMASRAQHLSEQRGERTVEVNLLSRALGVIEQAECLRPDGVDDDTILTSLARFDVLSNLAAVGASGAEDDRVFYPNFAQFRQDRIQPVVDRLLDDNVMRQTLFQGSDEEFARALDVVGHVAHNVGIRYDGFGSWARTPVGDFIEQHVPHEERRYPGF